MMKIKNKFFLSIWIFSFLFLGFLTTSYAETTVNTNSKAALLVEVSTGRILYEKNSTTQMYPASVTKVLTAIIVLENSNLNDMVTVSSTALENIPTGYVTCNLQVGEEISVEDLLYALMVPSANDAAYVLAEHIGGSIDGFSDMMNEKAKELGCTNTHFVNPNGIHDSNHYSTAYDLYLITNYAMKNDTFRKLVSTTQYTLPATNKYPSSDRILTTTNDLLKTSSKYYYKNAIGIKTGHTSQAGDCLIAEASRDGLEFITVVLGGGTTSSGLNSRFNDTINLFDYAYDNFTITKIKESNSIISTIEIENATKETKDLNLLIQDSITVINHKETNVENLLPEIKLKDDLMAPITSGDIIGTIKYTVDDVEYTSNLLAGNDVIQKPDFSLYFIIGGVILLILAMIMIIPKKKNKRRNYSKRRKM